MKNTIASSLKMQSATGSNVKFGMYAFVRMREFIAYVITASHMLYSLYRHSIGYPFMYGSSIMRPTTYGSQFMNMQVLALYDAENLVQSPSIRCTFSAKV